MPASSRKRNKGKERKAKQLAKKEENEKVKAHEHWRSFYSSKNCDHGHTLMISDDHPVSSFMDNFYINLLKRHEEMKPLDLVVSETLRELFKSHVQIWNNESYRRLTIGILVRIGTDTLLRGDDVVLWSGAVCLAQSIVILEHYDGPGSINVALNCRRSISKRRDLEGDVSSITRDTLKFFRKRTSCKCLKKMHLEARKSAPKMGICWNCKAKRERNTLSLCSRCMIFQYCSRECQLADWSAHERNCGVLVYHNNRR